MANTFGAFTVSNSIATFLRNAYEQAIDEQNETPGPDDDPFYTLPSLTIQPISSGQLADEDLNEHLTLYLYRISINEYLRNIRRESQPGRFEVPLSVDLHYMLTVWYRDAFREQAVMSWAMQQIYQHPTLTVPVLSQFGGWRSGDVVQLVPSELSNEDLMRIWDALQPSYRLSFCYTARVVQIQRDGNLADGDRRVVASRFQVNKVETAP